MHHAPGRAGFNNRRGAVSAALIGALVNPLQDPLDRAQVELGKCMVGTSAPETRWKYRPVMD